MPTVGATTMLDRLAHKRSDDAFVKSKLKAAGRALPAAGRPEARHPLQSPSAPPPSWRGSRRRRSTEFGLPVADALFLGVDGAGTGYFALAVNEHRTRHVPGAVEKLRPIVDLRSLAMQGAMSPEELSLCGQARALGPVA